jgi:2-polyprenyl-3-methyl-5-hydroxy-6-metoxy-1,4-benzoquinol methylase
MTDAASTNRAFYDTTLPGRDDYWRKMAAPRARVKQLVDLLDAWSPRRIVDLGSGGGQLLEELLARYPEAQLTGVDISTKQLEENARRLPSVRWSEADLDAQGGLAGRVTGTFDVVIASELIEHLDHPDVFLANARTLATPSTGRLVLSTQSGPVRETERRVGHRRHWTRREMVQALTAAGWAPERVWNSGFPFHDASKWYANRNPDASMDRFAAKPYGLREDLICAALRAAFRLNSRRIGAQLYAVARRPGP